MSVTIDELRATEEILTNYFKDMKALNIWKASIHNSRERKKRLEARIQSEVLVKFTDNVKSSELSAASPTNRQPPKGIDACIDKAYEIYDNLLIDLNTTELDIIVTEGGIEKLEQKTLLLSEAMNALSDESRKILELKFRDGKSFEEIGDIIRKSKSAVHDFYKKVICDVCKWLKYMNVL